MKCIRVIKVAAAASCFASTIYAQGSFNLPVCRMLQGEFEVQYAKPTLYVPKSLIGVSTAYNNKKHPIQSIWHPIPASTEDGMILDLQSWALEQKMPNRFLLGDGALTRSFMLVDQQKGTKLDAILELFVGLLPGVRAGQVEEEKVLFKFLQKSMDTLVQYRWRPGVNSLGENFWDPKDFQLSEASKSTFKASVQLQPGQGFYATDQKFSVVLFENFLQFDCAAYCIQKSLLAKLLLDRLGVSSRLVTGSTVSMIDGDMKTSGHSWVEFKDSRGQLLILDPEQELMGPKGSVNEFEADWFWFHGYNRRPNQYFPILVQKT